MNTSPTSVVGVQINRRGIISKPYDDFMYLSLLNNYLQYEICVNFLLGLFYQYYDKFKELWELLFKFMDNYHFILSDTHVLNVFF